MTMCEFPLLRLLGGFLRSGMVGFAPSSPKGPDLFGSFGRHPRSVYMQLYGVEWKHDLVVLGVVQNLVLSSA
jgi:hypothetical protein